MDLTLKKSFIYYIATLVFSWTCWILSMMYAARNDVPLLFNEGIYTLVSDRTLSSTQIESFLLFSLAPYGPIIGVFIAKNLTKTRQVEIGNIVRDTNHFKWLILVFGYPIVIFGVATLVSFLMTGFTGDFNALTMPLWFLPLFFLFQLFTSGLEEIGWRGYLQPVLQKKYTARKACFIVGVLWSIWHYPLLVYMNWEMGIFVVALTLLGYTMLTIPQAYVLGFLYNSTKSLLWCIILHAWANTVSAYLLVISPLPSVTPILVAVLVWLVAEFLVKKYGEDHLSTVHR